MEEIEKITCKTWAACESCAKGAIKDNGRYICSAPSKAEKKYISIVDEAAFEERILKEMAEGDEYMGPAEDDQETSFEQAYNQAVQTICDIQSFMPDMLFRSRVGIKVLICGESEADGDNVFKGVADALQRVAYKNDKQIRKGLFEFVD